MTHVVSGAEDVVPMVLLYLLFVAVDHMNSWGIQRDKLRPRTL